MKKDFSQKPMSKQEDWANSLPVIKALKEKGVQNFFGNFGNLSVALVDSFDQVVCMDEGTAITSKSSPSKKLCIAGSGILFPAESENERIEKVSEIFTSLSVKEITAHDGCGAAKLSILRDNPNCDPNSISDEEINRVSHDWSKKVFLEMQKSNPQTSFSYIPMEEMSRGPEFHNAVVAYFDFTGKFNPDFLGSNIPQGFVINPKVFGLAYALEELRVAIDISFGHHGFGKELFNSEYPFTIIAVFQDEEDLTKLDDLLKNHNFSNSLRLDRLVV